MHGAGLTATADVAGWSPIWNYTALAEASLDRFITMSTYTGNFTSFKNSLSKALASFPLSRYGCGLDTVIEGKFTKPFTYKEMYDRFVMIVESGVTEIDIWRTPIPEYWWPLLEAWVSGSPLPPPPPTASQ